MKKIYLLITLLAFLQIFTACRKKSEPYVPIKKTGKEALMEKDSNNPILDTSTESVDEIESFDETSVEESSIEETEETSYDSNTEVVRVAVNTEALNIRSEASLNSKILIIAQENQVFKVVSTTVDEFGTEWYEVELEGSITGFGSAEYFNALD